MSEKKKPGPVANLERHRICISLHRNTLAKLDRLKEKRGSNRASVITELIFHAKE